MLLLRFTLFPVASQYGTPGEALACCDSSSIYKGAAGGAAKPPTDPVLRPRPTATDDQPEPGANPGRESGMLQRRNTDGRQRSPETTATHTEPIGRCSKYLCHPARQWDASRRQWRDRTADSRRLLIGKNGPRDSTAADQFLWKAVAKENATATLLLSDLYRIGDGVPKTAIRRATCQMRPPEKNSPRPPTNFANFSIRLQVTSEQLYSMCLRLARFRLVTCP